MAFRISANTFSIVLYFTITPPLSVKLSTSKEFLCYNQFYVDYGVCFIKESLTVHIFSFNDTSAAT